MQENSNYLSLYRKYRPKNFADVIGQDFVIKTLKNSIKLNKIAHAYIFAGPKGIGKTTIAKIFSKAINCKNNSDGDSCLHCDICHLIQSNQTSDILELDAASNNGVENIRTITENSNFLPINCHYKVYIIDEAHMLTNAAWNALLKTLEESHNHVIFIFSTTEMHKIPGTILSRCQHFEFNKLSNIQLEQLIAKVSLKEEIRITPSAISQLIELSDGSARDCLSMLEQLALFTNNDIHLKDLNYMFGLLDRSNLLEIINSIAANQVDKIVNLAEQYDENGINFTLLINHLITIFIDCLIYKKTKNASILKKLTEKEINEINLNINQLFELINIWQKAYADSKKIYDIKFIFELALFNSFSIFNFKEEPSNKKVLDKLVTSGKNFVENIKKEIVKNDLPNPNEVFFYEETRVSSEFKKTKEVIQNNVTKNSSDIENLIFRIRKNKDEDAKKNAELFLGELQNTLILPSELELLKNAVQVLVASKNGVVLLFDNLIDSDLLNQNFNKNNFLNALKNYSESNFKYYVGLWKNNLPEIIKKFKINKVKIDLDLNIKDLKEVINEEDLALKLAREIFQN